MKGSNWIPAHVHPEIGSGQEYAENLLHASAEAGFNMLRVWGGGVYETDYFYQVRGTFLCNRFDTDAVRVAYSCATSSGSWFGRNLCLRPACTRLMRPSWTASAPRWRRPSGGCSITRVSQSGLETMRMRPRSVKIGIYIYIYIVQLVVFKVENQSTTIYNNFFSLINVVKFIFWITIHNN